MLDPKRYNIEAIKKMKKDHFFRVYGKKIKDADKVWEHYHPTVSDELEEVKPKKSKK
jgi:hypothetical protein